MNYKYSDRITRILGYSKEEALRLNNDYIGPEHLMLGLIREGNSRALDVLRRKFYVNIPSVKEVLERAVKDHGTTLLSTDIALNKKSTTIMRLTILEARLLKSEESDAEHMLLAILKQNDNTVARVLNDCDVSYKELYDSLSTQKASTQPKNDIDFDEEDDGEDAPPPSSNEASAASNGATTSKTAKKGNSDTPAIDKFGFDLTRAASEGKLSRRKKNNPVLIGEPGVGKSAIVEGLATRINERKVARVLFDKRIISLDMSSVVAGTKYRGQFEERMRSIINELRSNPNIIVFIDEIHTLVGAGNQAGQMDAANMMKPR